MIEVFVWTALYGIISLVVFVVLRGMAEWRMDFSFVASVFWPLTVAPTLVMYLVIWGVSFIENQRHGPRWRP